MSVLSRGLNSNGQVRVGKLKCFSIDVNSARDRGPGGVAHNAMRVAKIGFRPRGDFGGDVVDQTRFMERQCGIRAISLSPVRISKLLDRCFGSRHDVAYTQVRRIYKVAHSATCHHLRTLARKTRPSLRHRNCGGTATCVPIGKRCKHSCATSH